MLNARLLERRVFAVKFSTNASRDHQISTTMSVRMALNEFFVQRADPGIADLNTAQHQRTHSTIVF